MENEIKFLNNLNSFGEHTAIISGGEYYSYHDLQNKIDFWNEKLPDIQPGLVTGLEGDFTIDAIAILLVLIRKKAIVVPLEIKHKEKNAAKYDIARLEYLITVPFGEAFTVTEFARIETTQKAVFYQTIIGRNVAGLVLFTSGSSGEPKAAVHDFSKLLQKFEQKSNSLRTINFLLFDHWGGLNTLFHILSSGGTIITLSDRTPESVCAQIEKFGAELLPASPSFLNLLLLSQAYKDKDLSSLKIISYGTEPMPENLLKRLNAVFPSVSFRQTYGLIELGVLRAKSENNESLWVKIGGEGYETRVVDGLLEIKAEAAMLGYLNAPSPFTPDGWFMTGDSVEIKDDYFRILGRQSEIINVGGEKVFPQEVENVILEVAGVESVTVYGAKNPLLGNVVYAKVTVNNNSLDLRELGSSIKKHCNAKLARYKVPVKILFTEDILISTRYKKDRMGAREE